MSEAVFAIIGIFIGSFVTIYVHKQDRKDKYRFAMVKDKFQIYQEAYNHSRTMLGVLTGIILREEYHVTKAFEKIENWFNGHLLYLEPKIRSDFKTTIKFIQLYGVKLDMMTKTREDDNEEANNIYSEIEAMHNRINELPARIESCMDMYYN